VNTFDFPEVDSETDFWHTCSSITRPSRCRPSTCRRPSCWTPMCRARQIADRQGPSKCQICPDSASLIMGCKIRKFQAKK
jgi:hypothetical protein